MICRYCGTQNDENAVFCIGCGNKIEAAEQPAQGTYSEGPVNPTEPVNSAEPVNPNEPVNNGEPMYNNQADFNNQPAYDQPMYNGGATYNNGNQQEPKKKFPVAMLIVGIVAAILIIVGIVLITKGFNSDSDDEVSATVSDDNDKDDDSDDEDIAKADDSDDDDNDATKADDSDDDDDSDISGDYVKYSESYYVSSYWSEDSTSLDIAFADGNVINIPVSEDTYKSYSLSVDSEKALFLGNYANDKGTLYYVTSDDYEVVSEDAYEYFYISSDGSTAIYLSNVDGMTATLNKYDTESGDSEVIDEEVYYYGNIAISPDGQTIAYSKDYDSSKEEFTSYVKCGSDDVIEIGKNLSFLSVANDAKSIVYSDAGMVTAQAGTDGEPVKLDEAASGTLVYNYDLDELLFANESTAYYWDTDLSAPEEISGVFGEVYMLTNTEAAYSYNEIYDDDFNDFSVYFEGASSIKGNFYFDDYAVYYLGEDSCEMITDSCYYYSIGCKDNGFFYADGTDNCYVISDPASSLEPETVAEDVDWQYMAVTESDFSTIYYIDSYDDLYMMKDGEEKRVDMGASKLYMDPVDGDVVYYISSDDLKIYRPEDKTTQMVFNQESVTDVYTDAYGTVYFESDAGDDSIYIYRIYDEDQYEYMFN